MTFEQLLLAAVEQRLLRPLDVQFALMVAQNDPPAVKLAAALLSRELTADEASSSPGQSSGAPASASSRSRISPALPLSASSPLNRESGRQTCPSPASRLSRWWRKTTRRRSSWRRPC